MKQRRLRVGILTSGGDAPGMNAVIRAVVRTGLHYNMRIYGIKGGYQGLFRADVNEMETTDVSDIISRGGTILRTARCLEMIGEDGQRRAAEVIKAMQLDAIIVVGGDGSFKGAMALSKLGIKVICIPATIDLDMDCTEYTIGFDTAVNTAANAIMCIRDTSSSHDRCSIVEVMGRNAGYLALWCGMVGGAEEVIFPENPVDNKAVMEQIMTNRAKGRRHHLIVVAEGVGGSGKLAKEIEDVLDIETRATVLGHMQRGGTPTALDRMHASVMGYMAVKAIKDDEVNKVVVYRKGEHDLMDLEEALKMRKGYDSGMYDITKILAI
ncbi:MAG: 6-phosphofructokinase [Defluviitaleaceae bacterium]|nr:6-phosphofructokinase [Defluviitaleaceae bacterium]